MFWLSCSGCKLFCRDNHILLPCPSNDLSCPWWAARLFCTDQPVPAVLSQVSSAECPVTAVLPPLSLLGCPVPAVLSLLLCGCPVLSFLPWLPRLSPLAVLSWLSSPGCPLLAVLSRLSFPGCLFLATLSRLPSPGGPVPDVLPRHSCPQLSCHRCPVVKSCLGRPVHSDLSGLTYQDWPVLAVLSYLFCLRWPLVSLYMY